MGDSAPPSRPHRPAPRFASGAVIGAFFLAGYTSFATVLIDRGAEARLATADALVIARTSTGPGGVLRARSFWRDGRIYTDLTLDLVASLRGSLSSSGEFVLRLPGGTVGSIAQHLPGTPVFSPGETQFLVLHRCDGAAAWCVLDLSLGRYPMSVGRAGEWTVHPPSREGLELVPSAARPPEVLSPLPLSTFVGRIRGAAR